MIMKLTYKTTDGTEFDTQEKAIAHENVTEAYKGYQDAARKLQIAIGEKLITADGYPFMIGGLEILKPIAPDKHRLAIMQAIANLKSNGHHQST
jgi:hypothetical protein